MILFALPKLCLRLPPRGGRKKRKSFESEPFIVARLKRAKAGDWKGLWEEARQAEKKKKKDKGTEETPVGVRERVTTLVEEGRFSKAVQALSSEGIHRLDKRILDILRSKHPVGKGLRESAMDAPGEGARFEVDEVLKAVASFPSGMPRRVSVSGLVFARCLDHPSGGCGWSAVWSSDKGGQSAGGGGCAGRLCALDCGCVPLPPAEERWRGAAGGGWRGVSAAGGEMFLRQVQREKRGGVYRSGAGWGGGSWGG